MIQIELKFNYKSIKTEAAIEIHFYFLIPGITVGIVISLGVNI